MKSSVCNQDEPLPCAGQFDWRSSAEQSSQVADILRPRHVITRQHLQGDQVSDSGNAHLQLRQKFEHFGVGHDLRFDPGRGEQQVDDR